MVDEDGSAFQVELVFDTYTLGPNTIGAPEYIGDGKYSISYVATKVRQKRVFARLAYDLSLSKHHDIELTFFRTIEH